MAHIRRVDIADRRVSLEVLVWGTSPQVVLLPSAGRDATDFERLAGDLGAAGFDSLAVNFRTIGESTGPSDGLTLHDLADDIAQVICTLVGGPAHLVGHAFGNTVARATASYYPEMTASVTLLACGGHDNSTDRPSKEWMWHYQRCSRTDLSDQERIKSLRVAFFAPGNDPSPWLSGWWPDRLGLATLLARSNPSDWWQAGQVPLLIVQPLDDALGPPRVGRKLAAALGDRARYVELLDCGHAILPEQPAAVSRNVIQFLRDLAGPDRRPIFRPSV
jgi:pimeloyl-ACP methyl ester carboxylesterase